MILLVGNVLGEITDNNVLSWWYMDETTGNLEDYNNVVNFIEIGTVNSQTGIIGNSRGIYSTSNRFISSDNRLSTDNEFSINAWIYYNGSSLPLYSIFLAWNTTVSNKLQIFYTTDGTPRFIAGMAGNDAYKEMTLSQGWYHIIYNWHGTDDVGELFINASTGINGSGVIGTDVGSAYSLGSDSAGNNPSNCFYIDEFGILNQTLSQDDIDFLYNSHYARRPPFDPSTDIYIRTYDSFDNSSIQNFTAYITWDNSTVQTESTTNGSIFLYNVSDVNRTIDVLSVVTDYFNASEENITIVANTTNNINLYATQAIACFNATEKISDDYLSVDNFWIGDNSGTCFNLTAGVYNVTAVKAGWFNLTEEITISALSNTTYTLENMSYNELTVYARSVLDGSYLSSYDLDIISLNHTDWSGESVSSVSNYSFYLINGSYNLSIDASGYAVNDTLVTLSLSGNGSYTFWLYPTNSLNLSFYDESDNTLLNTANISFSIILNDANATTGNTSNGTYWVSGLSPGDYEIRYSAVDNGFSERSYFFTLVNRSVNHLSLYLSDDGSLEDITVTLYDEYGTRLEGYEIRLLRYYASESGYLVVDEGMTNTFGQTIVSAIQSGPYYKFRVLDTDGSILKTTSSAQLTSTSLTIYVTLGAGIGDGLDNLLGIYNELTFLDASNQFKFTWNNEDGTSVIANLSIYTVDLTGDTYWNSSVITSSSGTIYISVTEVNGTTYKAISSVTFPGDEEPTDIDVLTKTFDEGIVFGDDGLFVTILIIIVFAFMGIWNPALPCIFVPLALAVTRIFSFHMLAWTWIVSAFAVGIVIIIVIKDRI